jgi:hypothetical protein
MNSVVWVQRDRRKSPSGRDWEKFLAEQEVVLNSYAGQGWRLVNVLPVLSGGSASYEIGLEGVLLYFAPR